LEDDNLAEKLHNPCESLLLSRPGEGGSVMIGPILLAESSNHA
jgi:hypothetical protein